MSRIDTKPYRVVRQFRPPSTDGHPPKRDIGISHFERLDDAQRLFERLKMDRDNISLTLERLRSGRWVTERELVGARNA